jgi:hypothetical protein
MKKFIFLFSLLGLTLGACRSLHVHDFHTSQSLPTRLPTLGLLVHERSFLEAYDYALGREVFIGNMAGGPYAPAPWVAYSVTDQALQDAFQVLGNELSNNMSQVSDPQYGHARFKLLYYKRRNSGWGWTAATAATLMLPNIFGMPVRTQRAEMELQMELVDANGKILTRYVTTGVGKASVAAYHGYDNSTATRKANLLALQNAMSKIKDKLQFDVPTLSNQLESAGTLRKLEGK